MSRPPGVPWMIASLRFTFTFALVVSIVGDDPATVIVSATEATFNCRSSGVV